jgi:hypothetical protein
MCVYEAHQPYSLTFISSIHPSQHPHIYCTYYTVLFYIFNSKVNVQRGFLMHPAVNRFFFGQFNPLCKLSMMPEIQHSGGRSKKVKNSRPP